MIQSTHTQTRSSTMKRFLATVLGSIALAVSSHADGRNPGSLLVFPEYRFGGGVDTIITITNTHATEPTTLHINYVSGVPGPTLCSPRDRTVELRPLDTFTALVSAHNAGGPQQGYVFVFAEGANGARSFNHLVGDTLTVDATLTSLYSVEPIVFRSPLALNVATDLDMDGIRDLNGNEYERAPDQILIPRFMGQSATYTSDLVLVALSGGRRFSTIVDFLAYNDNEEIFSAQYEFACWDRAPLTVINGIFTKNFLQLATNQNMNEIVGAITEESGWIWINGHVASSTATDIPDPAILAVLVERSAASKVGASMPFFKGTQLRGDLLPSGVGWDGD